MVSIDGDMFSHKSRVIRPRTFERPPGCSLVQPGDEAQSKGALLILTVLIRRN